jgi:hypothetical protein
MIVLYRRYCRADRGNFSLCSITFRIASSIIYRMKYRSLLLPALLLMLAAASCKKETSTELEGSWLFPIAKGALSLNSLSSLKNLKYHINIPAQSISQPVNIPVSSPGLRLAHVGPFPVQITDWLHRLDVDTLGFSGTLNNVFPIPIGAGTSVVMRTSRDTSGSGNIAGAAVINSNVPPGGQFSFDIQVLKKTLTDSVFFFLENFNSPPYSNVTFTTSATQLDITLHVLTASYVEIYTNRSYVSRDTTDFSAGSGDLTSSHSSGSLADTGIAGIINVFADNGLPSNSSIQIYFLDNSKARILDSLFFPTSFTVERGRTDGAGNPSYIASTSVKVPVSKLKLDNIKQAAFVISQFQFNTMNTPGPWVSANRNPSLAIQLTGDLKLNIRF